MKTTATTAWAGSRQRWPESGWRSRGTSTITAANAGLNCASPAMYIPLNLPIDIRHDVAWNAGYVDVFVNGQRVTADPCDVLVDHVAACDSVEGGRQVMTDKQWLTAPDPVQARAIVLGDDAQVLSEVAARWRATLGEHQPLLLHAYFPRAASPDFAGVEIPRPVPLLPVLIRAAVYTHAPGADHPSVDEQAELVAAAIRLLRGTARRSNH